MNLSEAKHLHKDLTPAKLDPVSDVLLKAAAILERYGHCKNIRHNQHGSFCLMGAISMARFGTVDFDNDAVVIEAATRVARTIGGTYDAATAVHWNNEPERTAEEVIARLRAVAFSS